MLLATCCVSCCMCFAPLQARSGKGGYLLGEVGAAVAQQHAAAGGTQEGTAMNLQLLRVLCFS